MKTSTTKTPVCDSKSALIWARLHCGGRLTIVILLTTDSSWHRSQQKVVQVLIHSEFQTACQQALYAASRIELTLPAFYWIRSLGCGITFSGNQLLGRIDRFVTNLLKFCDHKFVFVVLLSVVALGTGSQNCPQAPKWRSCWSMFWWR